MVEKRPYQTEYRNQSTRELTHMKHWDAAVSTDGWLLYSDHETMAAAEAAAENVRRFVPGAEVRVTVSV